jgi:hypothetical protein
LRQVDGGTGDIASVIRDTFKERRCLGHGHHKTQVTRCRLSQDEDIDALPVDFNFQRIDGVIVLQHFTRGRDVPINQRVHRPAQCRFSFAAETKHSIAQRVEFLVEMSMNLHLQPNLPVM